VNVRLAASWPRRTSRSNPSPARPRRHQVPGADGGSAFDGNEGGVGDAEDGEVGGGSRPAMVPSLAAAGQ
jgi:hypothetical protein